MSGTNPFRRRNTGDQSFNNPLSTVSSAISDRSEARITPIDTGQPRNLYTAIGVLTLERVRLLMLPRYPPSYQVQDEQDGTDNISTFCHIRKRRWRLLTTIPYPYISSTKYAIFPKSRGRIISGSFQRRIRCRLQYGG